MKNLLAMLFCIPLQLSSMSEQPAPRQKLQRVASGTEHTISAILNGLRQSVIQGDEQRLTQLLKNDSRSTYLNTHSITKEDDQEETLLLATIQTPKDEDEKKRRARMVEKLIKAGASVNECSTQGLSPLLKAVFLEQKEIAEILLKNDAKITCGSIVLVHGKYDALTVAELMNQKELLQLMKNKIAARKHAKSI